jgi:hypothetical protein
VMLDAGAGFPEFECFSSAVSHPMTQNLGGDRSIH